MALSEEERDRASFREVVALVDGARKEILAEIEKLNAKLDSRFDNHAIKHEAEQQTHAVEHRQEEDRRAGRQRWMVTTILTAGGTLFAVVWALVQGGS